MMIGSGGWNMAAEQHWQFSEPHSGHTQTPETEQRPLSMAGQELSLRHKPNTVLHQTSWTSGGRDREREREREIGTNHSRWSCTNLPRSWVSTYSKGHQSSLSGLGLQLWECYRSDKLMQLSGPLCVALITSDQSNLSHIAQQKENCELLIKAANCTSL